MCSFLKQMLLQWLDATIRNLSNMYHFCALHRASYELRKITFEHDYLYSRGREHNVYIFTHISRLTGIVTSSVNRISRGYKLKILFWLTYAALSLMFMETFIATSHKLEILVKTSKGARVIRVLANRFIISTIHNFYLFL
jgi:phage antirepressor YoqD-like protein